MNLRVNFGSNTGTLFIIKESNLLSQDSLEILFTNTFRLTLTGNDKTEMLDSRSGECPDTDTKEFETFDTD